MESFDVLSAVGEEDAVSVEMFKSWGTFAKQFEDIERMRVVTYCDSPKFIHELFSDIEHLAEMEVVVGDVTDYRERLIDKPDLADALERLRRDGTLVIYTCSHDVHSKLYLMDHTDGTATCLVGSPNLSKHAWGRQANLGLVCETESGSTLYERFEGIYEEHRGYGEEFLTDLTKRIENSEKEREEVIRLFTSGNVGATDELGEAHGKLVDSIDEEADPADIATAPSDESGGEIQAGIDEAPEERITLSLRGFDDSTIDTLSEMEAYDARVSRNQLSASPRAVHRFTTDVFDVPTMRVWRQSQDGFIWNDPPKLRFHHEGTVYRIDQPWPEPETVDEGLAHIEAYLETIDEHGETNDPEAVKAMMYEALLWFFWAPFANVQADFYRRNGIADLDKALSYLYIHGRANSGKGTFVRFALSMISRGLVTGAIDADDITVRRIRNTRSANTAFPLVIDDITRDKIESLNPLRNYWKNSWTGERSFPMLAFTSNDSRPKKWFRERSKILEFNVRFGRDQYGAAAANRLIEDPPLVFSWFAHKYLRTDFELSRTGDEMQEARQVMESLYEYAERPIPKSFPDEPAEEAHDLGQKRWEELLAREDVFAERDEDTLVIHFPDAMQTELYSYQRDIPMHIQADKRGLDIVIRMPDAFYDWIGEVETKTSGLFGRIRKLV